MIGFLADIAGGAFNGAYGVRNFTELENASSRVGSLYRMACWEFSPYSGKIGPPWSLRLRSRVEDSRGQVLLINLGGTFQGSRYG